MNNTPANASTRTRGARGKISVQRQGIAQAVKADEMIAMESADDAQGFSFWLARAKGPAYKHTGEREEKDGRTLIPNTWYIDVCYYERFPLNSPSTFKLGQETYLENAERVISRKVSVQPDLVQRSLRSVSTVRRLISLDPEEIERLNDLPSLDSLST